MFVVDLNVFIVMLYAKGIIMSSPDSPSRSPGPSTRVVVGGLFLSGRFTTECQAVYIVVGGDDQVTPSHDQPQRLFDV